MGGSSRRSAGVTAGLGGGRLTDEPELRGVDKK
jgi:hypothetical protein